MKIKKINDIPIYSKNYCIKGKIYNITTIFFDNSVSKEYSRVRTDIFNNKTYHTIRKVFNIYTPKYGTII